MKSAQNAAMAYANAASHRSLRDQEADLFKRVNYMLKSAHEGRKIDQVRAIADNRRLWSAVVDLLNDPDNALPQELRASIISVGRAVQREMQNPAPNFTFLIAINENMAAGLSGQG
jgi:flagellar biosynthesis activator protein FlaF